MILKLLGLSKKEEPVGPADPYSKYMLNGRKEILFLLRAMKEHRSQMTLAFNEGRDMVLTALLDVGEDHIVLDYGPTEDTNRKAIAAKKLFCTATHEKVKVQFLLHRMDRIDFKGRPAFRAGIPDSVLRLQRREYYRLATPALRPLKCHFTIKRSDGPSRVLEARVIDISGGGVALTPPSGFALTTGMTLTACRIELPDGGIITTDMVVRSVFEVTLRSGNRAKRAGCEFVNLSGAMQNLIQRYIIKVERERKARIAGTE